jgi:molybdopterin synthase catalytic subunit
LEVTATAIDPAALERLCQSSRSGAVVTFQGVVRDHDDGHAVSWLRYEAHPAAAAIVRPQIVDWLEAHPAVESVAIVHRVGDLRIGDLACVVVAASAHRAAAFTACAELVDLVKAELPVWKHQGLADGSAYWVGVPT